jgi:hypothetical protein
MKKHKKSKSDVTASDISIISDEMELSEEVKKEKELLKKTLPSVPSLIKTDITLDTIFSDCVNTELQLRLQKQYNNHLSPMCRVADYLELHRITLKGKEIFYKQLALVLHLTEQQVYNTIKDLNAFEGYCFKFHPTRKPHMTTDDFGSFEYSLDNFTRWAKENDIREKTINRKIIVVQQSQEHMLPVYKEKMKAYKIKRVKDAKKRIIDLQTVSVPVASASSSGDEEEAE